MKVYQIVAVKDETVGHGSSAAIAVVASKNAYAIDPFPLYTDRTLAETAAAEVYKKHFVRASVLELELL
jgi:hypothetical protein